MIKKHFVRGLATVLALALSLTGIGSLDSYAQVSDHKVTFKALQNQAYVGAQKVEFELHINTSIEFSSADLAFQLEGDCKVDQVTSLLDNKANFIGPTLKDNVYYLGFFGTKNQFSGQVPVARVRLLINGDKPVKVLLGPSSTTVIDTSKMAFEKSDLILSEALTISRITLPVNNEGDEATTQAPTTTDEIANDSVITPEDLIEIDGQEVPLGTIGVYFEDIKNNWAKTFIYSLASFGVIKGKSETHYAPKDAMKRSEFLQLLMNAYDLEAVTKSKVTHSFKDVPTGAYYEKALSLAYTLGIVKGTEGRFFPNEPIKRQEMMVLLHRAMVLKGVDFDRQGNLLVFKDYQLVAPYAIEAISQLVGANIIEGTMQKLMPLDYLRRDEAAKVIYYFRMQTSK